MPNGLLRAHAAFRHDDPHELQRVTPCAPPGLPMARVGLPLTRRRREGDHVVPL